MITENPDLIEATETIELGRFSLNLKREGNRSQWDEDSKTLSVNTTTFSSLEAARSYGVKMLSLRAGFSQLKNRTEIAQKLKNTPPLQNIIGWQGLRYLASCNREYQFQGQVETHPNYEQEFLSAIEYFALNKKLPPVLSETVAQEVDSLERSIKAIKPSSRIDDLLSELMSTRVSLESRGQLYLRYITPALQNLAQVEKDASTTHEFNYQPPQAHDAKTEKEILKKEDIKTLIGPKGLFGYFRERRCQLDPTGAHGMSRPALPKHQWSLDLDEVLEREPQLMESQRPYVSIFNPGEENILPWNKHSLPLIETLEPAGLFRIMQDTQGGISIEARQGVEIEEPTPFQINIVLSNRLRPMQDDQPEAKDSMPQGGPLSDDADALLKELSSARLKPIEKALQITRFMKQKFRYPEDETEIALVDSTYQPLLEGDIKSLWSTMLETGIAHCYWANMLKNELCHRLNIPAGIMEGAYATPDPRFDFSVIEAPGLDKHAWSIIWDENRSMWIDDGQDATPAKKSDQEKEEGEKGPGIPGGAGGEFDPDGENDDENETLDGDFSKSNSRDQLSDEELEALYEEIEEQAKADAIADKAAEQFEAEKSVKYEDWKKFEATIAKWGEMYVAPEDSIDGQPSTLALEDRKLTELIRLKRQIPFQRYRGPVRQSEGHSLVEPVSAFIASRAGEDDPIGWDKPDTRVREKIEITEFEQDFICDRSYSMRDGPAIAQRQLVVQSLYYDWKRNQLLQHSRTREQMTTPLDWRSQVLSFTQVPHEHLRPDEPMTEKKLLEIYAVLEDTPGPIEAVYACLKRYIENLTPEDLAGIKTGKKIKVLTLCTDGNIPDQQNCKALVQEIREMGIIVQGIGFGHRAINIDTVCGNPNDPFSAVVVEDVTKAPLARANAIRNLTKRFV